MGDKTTSALYCRAPCGWRLDTRVEWKVQTPDRHPDNPQYFGQGQWADRVGTRGRVPDSEDLDKKIPIARAGKETTPPCTPGTAKGDGERVVRGASEGEFDPVERF